MLTIILTTTAVLLAQAGETNPTTPNRCEALLTQTSPASPTEHLIAYLAHLLDKQIIGDEALIEFDRHLDRGRIPNPIPEDAAESSASLFIHREGVERYLKGQEINLADLKIWTRRTLIARGLTREAREETENETRTRFAKAEFLPLRPGRFFMGDKDSNYEVTLTHPFEVMSTPVTQKQWVDVMGVNPSGNSKGEGAIPVTINGNSVSMKPDNPVELITWWSALVYANRLSEKHGLQAAYDLSGVTFDNTTSAERGTLKRLSGELKINAPGFDIYRAQGYRLPTEAEQEYLLRAAGRANGAYYFADEANLASYAWYDSASEPTHPVAELKALVLDGKEIYDLLGNVWELGHDERIDPTPREGYATNPIAEAKWNSPRYRIARGGCARGEIRFLRSPSRNSIDENAPNSNFGFRLVRTLR